MSVLSLSLQQMLSGGILGQSPVAHGFMQSLQQHHHHHHSGSHPLPYSTPLGPLSPYGPSSSSHHTGLPVRRIHRICNSIVDPNKDTLQKDTFSLVLLVSVQIREVPL